MYHAMVKRIARKSFRRINDKYFDALLVDCAPDIHTAHALSGERHHKEG